GLLPEVVVDPVDLALVEVRVDERVELLGRGEIVPERFLDDEPRPALALVCALVLADLEDGGLEDGRRHGEVIDAVAGEPALLLQLRRALEHRTERAVVADALVGDAAVAPRVYGAVVEAGVAERLAEGVAEVVVAPVRAAGTEDDDLLGALAAEEAAV